MRRILAPIFIAASLFAASLAPALAQSCKTGYAQVIATQIQNINQVLLPSGTFTITGIDAQRQALNFSAPGGGTVTKSSVRAAVANGSLVGTVCVPRSDKASVYVRYHFTITDNSASGTRAVLVDATDVPITTDLFSIDTYSYPANAYANPPNIFSNGQVNGDLAVTGTITAGSIAAMTATNAQHAVLADTATSATTATHATSADTATHATSADSATSASTASSANTANTAVSATNAVHAALADQATHAAASDTATMATAAAALASTVPCGLNGSGVQQLMTGFSPAGAAICVDPPAGGGSGSVTFTGVVHSLLSKTGTGATGGSAYYVEDANSGGKGIVIGGDSTDAANGGPNNSFLNLVGSQFPQINLENKAAPAGLQRSRQIIFPDGSYRIQLMHDDNTDGDTVLYATRNSDGSIGTESLIGQVRLGGGSTGVTNCDLFNNNPSAVHPRLGLGTCTPATIYGVDHPNDSVIQAFDPVGNDAYLYAHSGGSGTPHVFFWDEGHNGAYDEHTDASGNYVLDNVAGQNDHHTMLQCEVFGSATQFQCRFTYGYAGVFTQTATNPFGPGNNWAGSMLTSNWATSPEEALTTYGTGQPNYASVVLGGYGRGGYNEYNPSPAASSNFFKSNWAGITGSWTWQGQGQHQMLPLLQNCWGVGDCIIGEGTEYHHGGGLESAAEQVHGGIRANILEDPNTAYGNCSGAGCVAGGNIFGLANGSDLNTLGEGHYMADLTAAVVSPGRLAPSQGQDPNTTLQINAVTGVALPVSQLFQTAAGVPSTPTSPAPGLVTVAIATSGVPSGYQTSTSGVPASGLACTYDRLGPAGQIGAKYTVIDATHLRLNLRVALSPGAMIALNGLCGQGIDPVGDQLLPEKGNMPLHPIAVVYASISPTQFLTHSATHLGTTSGGRAEYAGTMSVRNFVRTSGVASFDATGFRPDYLSGATVQVIGNDTNVAGVNYTLSMTSPGGYNAGVAHFTAADSRADYSSANTQASIAVDRTSFSLVPVAETIDGHDPNNIVVGDNVMPLNPNDLIIQTHTEVQGNGGADQNIKTTFSPQVDAPVLGGGCAIGGDDNSFMGAGDVCHQVDNLTRDDMYLGWGGFHQVPGAQYVTHGHFSAFASAELDRFGTAFRINPSNGDLAHWGTIAVFDFGASTTLDNQMLFTPNPNSSLYSTLSFGFMHTQFNSIYAPMYNAGPDAIPVITISAATGTGTYTTAAAYAAQPVCTGGATTLGAPVNFNGLGQAWVQNSGLWTLTLTAGTKPATDTPVVMSCHIPGAQYLN